MSKKILIYLSLIGLVSLLSFCKKDETRAVMLDNPIVPTLTVPSFSNFMRTHAGDSLHFVGTVLNPGFQASATYYLEADSAGNKFASPVVVYTGKQDLAITLAIADVNSALLKRFPADMTSSVEFRIRAVLEADAGLGVTAKTYYSSTSSASVAFFGLPRLDLVDASGAVWGSVYSKKGDGNYTGYSDITVAHPIQFKNPDTGTLYGGGSTLTVSGAAISVSADGWYQISVTIGATSTQNMAPYMISIIGDAVLPNAWSTDDWLSYDYKTASWIIKNVTLGSGNFKFRLNSGWAWNLGGKGTADGSADNFASDNITVPNLTQGGHNIPLLGGAGVYTITLDINNNVATVVKK